MELVITIDSDVSQQECIAVESDSEDEPPEDLSLKLSKERAQEILKQQNDARHSLKEKKKQQHKEWQMKNKKQKQDKKKKQEELGESDNEQHANDETQKATLIPEKLSDSLLQVAAKTFKVDTDSNPIVSNKLHVKNTVQFKKSKKMSKRNKRIKFNDIEEGDGDNEQSLSSQNIGIKAKFIGAVSKNDVSKGAREFLQQHFYGRRLKRQPIHFVKSKSRRMGKRTRARK